MRAVLCSEYGPPGALRIGDVPRPEPGPNEILVRVAEAGVNFPDGLIVQGKYQTKPELPFVPGSEMAGAVAALGHGVTAFIPGDRVAAFTGIGAFADYVTVPAAHAFRLPDAVSFTDAAGLLITYGTSYHALKDRACLKPGETLLVLGAGGGVGLAAVELGALMGARVIAAASTDQKLALARGRGAAETICTARDDLRERVKALTGGPGVDVVYDPVGGELALASVKALAWGGRHLIIGFAAGEIPKIPANLLLLKSAASVGVLWGASLRADPVHHAANVAQLLDWLAAGRIRPAIDRVFPMAECPAAIEHVLDRKALGKVIVAIGEGDAASVRTTTI